MTSLTSSSFQLFSLPQSKLNLINNPSVRYIADYLATMLEVKVGCGCQEDQPFLCTSTMLSALGRVAALSGPALSKHSIRRINIRQYSSSIWFCFLLRSRTPARALRLLSFTGWMKDILRSFSHKLRLLQPRKRFQTRAVCLRQFSFWKIIRVFGFCVHLRPAGFCPS